MDDKAREYADTETGSTNGFADTPQGIAYRAYLAGVAAELERCIADALKAGPLVTNDWSYTLGRQQATDDILAAVRGRGG